MSVKEWIIRSMSLNMMVKERIISTVIEHQFMGAWEALPKCESIEFSGFGKFWFNRKRAKQELDKQSLIRDFILKKIATEDPDEKKLHNLTMKLNTLNNNINILEGRLYEPPANIRGMEEQAVSPGSPEEHH